MTNEDDDIRSVETVFSGLRNAYIDDFPDDYFKVVGEEDDENNTNLQDQSKQVEERLQQIFSKLEFQDGSASITGVPQGLQITRLPIHQPHAYPCRNTYDPLPAHPSKWPQAPVMLRPSPYSHTRIRGIRYADTFEYQKYAGFCDGCILPINNGGEATSPLVIDFETKYFVGTLLLRIRDIPSANRIGDQGDEQQEQQQQQQNSHDDHTNYFDKKKRRFQCVVKGRFKVELPMSRCVTGHKFQRPGGKLPAKMVVSAFIKFVSTLAPQLEAKIDGATPCFLAPLAATAHSVIECDLWSNNKDSSTDAYCFEMKNNETEEDKERDQNKLMHYKFYRGAGKDIATEVEEPQATSSSSILPKIYAIQQCKKLENLKVTARQKARKKALNHVSAKKLNEPVFSTNKEYCFEFYQHLLLFHPNLAIDMGRPVGQVGIAQSLNGQPLNIMASFREYDNETKSKDKCEPLWNFELWHKDLYPYAETYYKTRASSS